MNNHDHQCIHLFHELQKMEDEYIKDQERLRLKWFRKMEKWKKRRDGYINAII